MDTKINVFILSTFLKLHNDDLRKSQKTRRHIGMQVPPVTSSR